MSVRSAATLVAAFSALVLSACSDPCQHLASQICYCLPDDGTRAACNELASGNEDVFSVSDTDAAYCQHLLDTNSCDCNKLTTEAGKEACGLVYSPDAGTPDAGTSTD